MCISTYRRWIWTAATATAFAVHQQQRQPYALGFVLQPARWSRFHRALRPLSSWSTPPAFLKKDNERGVLVQPTRTESSSTAQNQFGGYPKLASSSYSTTSRLYMSNRWSGDDQKKSGDGGFLSTLKNAAKAILPSSWFSSSKPLSKEEEQRARMIERQREMKKDVSGGLTELFKGAPLPIRMLGGLMTPLMSNALSSLAQVAQEQQSTVNDILQQATTCIQNDETALQVLGQDLQVSSTPFSQSTSSSSVNGQTTQRIELAIQVYGSLDTGVATISANEQGLQAIRIQTNRSGRLLQVSTTAKTRSGTTSRFGGRGSSSDDNIIEAEIIEKDVDSKRP